MMAVDERVLVSRALAQEGDAFRELLSMHKRLVYHIVVRMLPNASDHEDICQDVFVKVYQNLGRFNSESKLSTWIAAITHNTCVNFLKKKRLPLLGDFEPATKPVDDLMNDQSSPSKDAEAADLKQLLHRAITRLPVQYRTILTLYHLEEMSYQEIAGITGLPAGTVKSYLFRARKHLREGLLAAYPKEALCQ